MGWKVGEVMYYKQNTNNIQLVIMSFDDVLTNLSKLRYNYYRRLCKLYKQEIDKSTFINNMSSVRTMYDQCPIPEHLLNIETLTSKIEEDLTEYTRLYQLKKRDGANELLEYFQQKNIKFVLTSSHPKHFTKRLFDLGGFYIHPDHIYYDDDSIPLLPDTSLYQRILEDHQVDASHTLMIAANPASLKAANELRFNVLYYPLLEDVSMEMKIRSLAVISSLLEAINIIISKDQFGIQNNFLLLTGNDDATTLFNHYEALIAQYKDNEEATDCIETIYQNEFLRLQKQENAAPILPILEDSLNEDIDDFTSLQASIEDKQKPTQPLIIAASTAPETMVEDEAHKKEIEDLFKDETVTFDINDIEATKEVDLFTLAKEEEKQKDRDNQENRVEDDNQRTRVFTKEELKMFGVTEEDLDNDNDDNETYGKPSLIFTLIANIGYALMDSLLVCFAGGIGMIVLRDSKIDFLKQLYQLLIAYTDTANQLFTNITTSVQTSLHSTAAFGGFVSTLLATSIMIYLTLTIILITKTILQKKKKK